MTADGEIEPGPYWWKASALTITPTLLANRLTYLPWEEPPSGRSQDVCHEKLVANKYEADV